MRAFGRILVVGMLVGVAALVAQEPIRRDELGVSPLESLNALVVEKMKDHEKLVAKFGSAHPTAKQAEKELESLEVMRDRQLKKMPSWARQNVSSMDDDQLRYMVGVLVERVVRLEKDVKTLQNPEVKIELLNGGR